MEPKHLAFLRGIKKNNQKEWYEEHKEEYKSARSAFSDIMDQLAQEIAKFDPVIKEKIAKGQPVTKVFRIHRDARFARGKAKYKTNLSGYVAADPKNPHEPVYYLSIEPGGNSFFGGGLHAPERKMLNASRDYLIDHPKELEKIEKAATFRKYFPGLLSRAGALKTAPRGYDIDHEAVEYLRLQEYVAGKQLGDDVIKEKDLPKALIPSAKALYPLVAFLRKVL